MPTQRKADEAQIRRQIDEIVEALRNKDLEGLKRFYTTEVVSFDVEPPLQHVGVAAKARNWANVFAFFETVTYEVRDLTLTVGDDVAFGYAFARLSGTLKNGAATSGMWVRITYGLRKIDGTWLIAHDQVSVPLDIPTGKAMIDLEPDEPSQRSNTAVSPAPLTKAPSSYGAAPMEKNMSTIPATVAIPSYLVGTWKADPVHSEIAFSVRHLMISKTRGRFTAYDVTIVTNGDLLDSSVTATIDLASVETGNATRDDHLRTADYLQVEKYPTMDYRSTGVRRTDDGWIIDGELTLHGVTRQVRLAVEVNGFGADPWGGQRAGFSATAEINRRDFGIDISAPLDAGGVAVGDKVSISLEIQAVLQN